METKYSVFWYSYLGLHWPGVLTDAIVLELVVSTQTRVIVSNDKVKVTKTGRFMYVHLLLLMMTSLGRND